MNIVCWSPEREELSSYFAGLFATVCATEFPASVLAVENYLRSRNLGHCFFGARYDSLRTDFRQYRADSNNGDTYLEFFERNMGRRIRKRKCLEVLPDRLFFLPMNQSLPKDFYDYGIYTMYEEIRDFGRREFDFTVWNLETNRNPSTTRILGDADVILALVPGTLPAIEEFYLQCRSELSRIRLVLYCREGEERQLERTERKAAMRWGLDRKKIHRLCFGTHFLSAAENGNLPNFLEEQKRKREYAADAELLKQLRYLVFSVIRNEIGGRELEFKELKGLLYRRNHSVAMEA